MATAKLSKTAEIPKAPSGAEIARYLELREARLELERKAAASEREERELKGRLQAWVSHATKGLKTRVVRKCGHELSIEERAGSVSWITEFTKLAGQDEAERLKREAPRVERLAVRKL